MTKVDRPRRRRRQMIITAQIGFLVAIAPGSSFANNDTSDIAAIGYDLAVLRTLGSVKLVVGTVALIPVSILFMLKAPFSDEPGALQEAAEVLVVEPANFLFRRPLGEDFSGG